MKKVLAFDFGASSGRAVLAYVCGGKLKTEEIHRFKNEPVTVNGGMYWDVLRLFHEIKNGITAALKSGGFDAISVDTWGVDFGLIDKNGELLEKTAYVSDVEYWSVVYFGNYEVWTRYVYGEKKEELYKLNGVIQRRSTF